MDPDGPVPSMAKSNKMLAQPNFYEEVLAAILMVHEPDVGKRGRGIGRRNWGSIEC